MSEWDDLKKLPIGAIIREWIDKGRLCIIVRGPMALCAYVGIPSHHPLYGKHYDSIDVECHGGLTYSGVFGRLMIKGEDRFDDYWLLGWDYAHAGDKGFNPPEVENLIRRNGGVYSFFERPEDKTWTIAEIESQINEVLKQIEPIEENLFFEEKNRLEKIED